MKQVAYNGYLYTISQLDSAEGLRHSIDIQKIGTSINLMATVVEKGYNNIQLNLEGKHEDN